MSNTGCCGALLVRVYQRPAILDKDFGRPTELCQETAPGGFKRAWTASTVAVDCNAYTSEVMFK